MFGKENKMIEVMIFLRISKYIDTSHFEFKSWHELNDLK